MVRLEKIMNDERSPVEEDAGHVVRVLGELVAGEYAVEDETRIGERAWLHSVGRDAACVWCVR